MLQNTYPWVSRFLEHRFSIRLTNVLHYDTFLLPIMRTAGRMIEPSSSSGFCSSRNQSAWKLCHWNPRYPDGSQTPMDNSLSGLSLMTMIAATRPSRWTVQINPRGSLLHKTKNLHLPELRWLKSRSSDHATCVLLEILRLWSLCLFGDLLVMDPWLLKLRNADELSIPCHLSQQMDNPDLPGVSGFQMSKNIQPQDFWSFESWW